MMNYDEARSPRPTINLTGQLQDFEAAKDLQARFDAENYFDDIRVRWGYVHVLKRFYSPNRSASFYAEGWDDAWILLELGSTESLGLRRGSGGRGELFLRLTTFVDGHRSDKERERLRQKGEYRGASGPQRTTKRIDGRAIPRSWPGPGFLPSTLLPELRQRLSPIFAEAYTHFIKALDPAPPPEEEMHNITGWNEGRLTEMNEEEFSRLEKGDHFIWTADKTESEWVVTRPVSEVYKNEYLLATQYKGLSPHFPIAFWPDKAFLMRHVVPTPEEEMHTITGWNEKTQKKKPPSLEEEIRFTTRFLKKALVKTPRLIRLPPLGIERMHEITDWNS